MTVYTNLFTDSSLSQNPNSFHFLNSEFEIQNPVIKASQEPYSFNTKIRFCGK